MRLKIIHGLLKKTTANMRVCRAARKGLLPVARKLRCLDCGKRARDYDHYAGYEARNALVVQPVCRSCHVKREYKRGERKITIEMRRKNSAAHLGVKLSAVHCRSISIAHAGTKWSPARWRAFHPKTHCPYGHPYNKKNTYHSPGRMDKQCRTCKWNHYLRSKEKNK